MSARAMALLAIDGLTFAHEPGEKQVSGVSFELRSGRTFGILGGNECGKTTLAHLIMGNLTADSGTVLISEHQSAMQDARGSGPSAASVGSLHVAVATCIGAAAMLFVLDRTMSARLLLLAASLPLMLLVLAHLRRGANARSGWSPPQSGATETGFAPEAARARGIAYISSEHDAGQKLSPDATIEDVISEHMPLPKAAKAARRREVHAALTASGFQLMTDSGTPVGNPTSYLEDGLRVGELSGGQKHLIYILSVLAARPRLLICDEALCGLDIDRQASMLQLLQRLQARFGIAILYMTVDLTSFSLMAHEGAFMKHGRFLEGPGSAHELIEAPQRKDTQLYIQISQENEARSRGKNLRNAYGKGESVWNL